MSWTSGLTPEQKKAGQGSGAATTASTQNMDMRGSWTPGAPLEKTAGKAAPSTTINKSSNSGSSVWGGGGVFGGYGGGGGTGPVMGSPGSTNRFPPVTQGTTGGPFGSPGGVYYPGTGGSGGGGRGGGGAGGPGGGGWTPSNVPRPQLGPINPTAEYDPEVLKALQQQQGNVESLKQGTGYAMDVLTGAQADQLESQLIQARAAAQAAGIPFDEASWRAQAQRGIHGAMAQEKLGREQMVGTEMARAASTAQGLAGERTSRLGLDLQRDIAENSQKLDLYGRDIQKYGIDAQAATAANSALMSFYGQLMSGMFGMMGSGMSSSTTSIYG